MSNARLRRVLVVDNDPDFRRAVQRLLSAKGYTVFAASTPVEARQLAMRERVHVAVLDIRMQSDRDRDDMSGLALAEQLDPLVVKIMLSAYPSVEAVRSSYGDVSAFTFVEKEEGPDKLLKELATEKGTTKTEIIRRALAMYRYLDKETSDGTKRVSVTSAKTDKILKDVILP